ncbi:hypothetical protein ACJJTC_016610 [Scirpophaga incertulas]
MPKRCGINPNLLQADLGCTKKRRPLRAGVRKRLRWRLRSRRAAFTVISLRRGQGKCKNEKSTRDMPISTTKFAALMKQLWMKNLLSVPIFTVKFILPNLQFNRDYWT